MDIHRILENTKELLELRGEDGKEFLDKVGEIDIGRFVDEFITVNLKKYSIFYALSKDSFKELWGTIRNLSIEDMEKNYKNKKYLIIIGEYPPSITLQALQQKDVVFQQNQGFLQIFLSKEMMYNPNKHFLVPKHDKMTEDETKQLLEDLQLKTKTQLPLIQKTDIISRWLGLKSGDIVKITRYCETSGEYFYYRCCI